MVFPGHWTTQNEKKMGELVYKIVCVSSKSQWKVIDLRHCDINRAFRDGVWDVYSPEY